MEGYIPDKKTGIRLQAILDQVENVKLTFVFEDSHTLIKHCFQMYEIHQLISSSEPLPIDIQHMLDLERKYTDTAVNGLAGQLKLVEDAISKSNQNVAGNQLQLQNSLQGVKKAVNDITSHIGHQSQIIDTLKNQVDGNSKEGTMTREQLKQLAAELKDHQAVKHHNMPDPVVYA